jgi:hypothetical protein
VSGIALSPFACQTAGTHKGRKTMRFAVILAAGLALAACSELTGVADYPEPEFGVTAWQTDVPDSPYATFNRSGLEPLDLKAAATCTLGYQRTAEQPIPAEHGQFLNSTVHCNRYYPSLGLFGL